MKLPSISKNRGKNNLEYLTDVLKSMAKEEEQADNKSSKYNNSHTIEVNESNISQEKTEASISALKRKGNVIGKDDKNVKYVYIKVL